MVLNFSKKLIWEEGVLSLMLRRVGFQGYYTSGHTLTTIVIGGLGLGF